MNREVNHRAIFISIILAFMAMSAMAAAIEGPTGGVFGQKTVLGFSADFWILWVMVPLFLLPILLTVGLESKIIGTLSISYVLGGVIEDFFWFVVNPYYGLGRWNSTNVTWLDWVKLGPFEIPKFYILRLAMIVVLWLIFFRYAAKVNLFFKKYFPWATTKS